MEKELQEMTEGGEETLNTELKQQMRSIIYNHQNGKDEKDS